MTKSREHIVWPAAIIILLLSSVVMMTGVLFAARSDGGAQVVDDYYNSAVMWDSLQAIKDQSNASGWNVTFRIDSNEQSGMSKGVFVVHDKSDAVVHDILGQAVIRQPHLASNILSERITASETTPGEYTVSFPGEWRGLIDISLDARTGSDPIVFKQRIER